MSARKEVQKVIDKLIYNQLYAPDYPAEDRTTLDREKSQVLTRLDFAIASTRREDVGDWLRLGRSSIEEAFTNLKNGNQSEALRGIEFSIQYLRNAVTQKPHKIDFIGELGAGIIIAPPPTDD